MQGSAEEPEPSEGADVDFASGEQLAWSKCELGWGLGLSAG